LLLVAAAMSLMVANPVPAAAQTTGNTTVTFTVTAGLLAISVPGSADLGTVEPDDTAGAQIGDVVVTDERAQLNAAWTASVSATDFTTGDGTAGETIPNSAVRYWSGPATATTGSGTRTPGQPTAGDAETLDEERTAFSLTGGTGNNTTTWNPTVLVDVPASAIEGEYSGTVTHTVL
jgi:hypothetical protein